MQGCTTERYKLVERYIELSKVVDKQETELKKERTTHQSLLDEYKETNNALRRLELKTSLYEEEKQKERSKGIPTVIQIFLWVLVALFLRFYFVFE